MPFSEVHNPILRGFHPDPSIVRVGNDYYIATSTFEWWPAVRISHSTDLCNWHTLGYALTDPSQLDLRGVGASQGIWAPCLTYCDGLFYLAYTVVRSFYCNMYDTQNYLVTSPNILGPWSEPIALNNFGFDPSLFHDDDGRKYLVSMVTDHRVPKKYAGRIILQEYSHAKKKVIGSAKEIYVGKKIFLEGPHIFKRNGWYYLFSADTGTGEGHGQTIQRSRSIWGPYDMYRADFMQRQSEDEAYSIITTRNREEYPLQKAGHADLVQTSDGDWYAVHLCGRPLQQRNPPDAPRFANCRRYPLGRETAIQKVYWTQDDWLRLENGTNLPDVDCTIKLSNQELPPTPVTEQIRDDFDAQKLSVEWQSLRVPMDDIHCSLSARPSWLRMYGKEGLSSKFHQTLLARRWTEFRFEASTLVEFHPTCFKQMAGLICMYDTDNYLYLHLSHDEECGSCITILKAENKNYSYPVGFVPVCLEKPIKLGVKVDHEKMRFYYATADMETDCPIGGEFDCSFLSDEACTEGWFTGAMVGICCQDLTGASLHADFDWFDYQLVP